MPTQPRLFRADRPLSDEPKYFTRIPDEAPEDPRLTPTQFLILSCILKGNWTNKTVIYATQAEIARRARVTVKTVYNAFKRLAEVGLLSFERDYSLRGGPYRIVLTFQFRPSLELEYRPPVAKGSAGRRSGTPDRKPVSTPDRKPVSTPDRKPVSTPDRKPVSTPSFLEREETEIPEREREGETRAPTPEPSPPPASPAAPPDEQTTGRSGEEHRLFVEAWRGLESHEATRYLAGQLAMAADTPGIRSLPSWKLWVASRVVLRPDKSKEYGLFLAVAQRATEAEFHRYRDAESQASVAGAPPPPAPPPLRKSRAGLLIDSYKEAFGGQSMLIPTDMCAGVDRALHPEAHGQAPADRLAAPGERGIPGLLPGVG